MKIAWTFQTLRKSSQGPPGTHRTVLESYIEIEEEGQWDWVREGKQKWRMERKNRQMKSILERNLTGLCGEVQGWREMIQRGLNVKPH